MGFSLAVANTLSFFWPKIAFFGHFGPGFAGSFGALLVDWLVVVARGLYLARHLFTLCNIKFKLGAKHVLAVRE